MSAAIDIIAQEQIIDVRNVARCGRAAVFREQAHQVTKLTVQVAEDLDWRRKLEHRAVTAERENRLSAHASAARQQSGSPVLCKARLGALAKLTDHGDVKHEAPALFLQQACQSKSTHRQRA